MMMMMIIITTIIIVMYDDDDYYDYVLLILSILLLHNSNNARRAADEAVHERGGSGWLVGTANQQWKCRGYPRGRSWRGTAASDTRERATAPCTAVKLVLPDSSHWR